MKDNLIDVTRSRFTALSQQFSATQIERTGWTSKSSQLVRFQVFREIIGNASSVLDVGCGTGDFFDYLRTQGFRGTYLGIDLIEANCEAARTRFDLNVFEVANIQTYTPARMYDFVLASGIFFLAASDWRESVIRSFDSMFAICTNGFAANFLSTASLVMKESLRYADPSLILALAAKYSLKYSLRHDYAEKNNDFTIAVFKN